MRWILGPLAHIKLEVFVLSAPHRRLISTVKDDERFNMQPGFAWYTIHPPHSVQFPRRSTE